MIEAIFFWQDGVITTSLAEVAIGQLERAINAALDTPTRMAIRDWALELQLGKVDRLTFCREALHLTKASLEDQELAARIQSEVTWIRGVREILEELEGKYGLWLLAHCPRDWLLPIVDRLELRRWFPGESILVCPEAGLTKFLPDLFYLAVERAGKPIENCLLVAADSATTTAAVNIGLNAIIFSDAYRLRRELGLRGLLPPL